MTWMDADYRSYPARCVKFHREAVLRSPKPLLVGAFRSRQAARSESWLYSRFRYLVRNNPGIDFSLDELFSRHKFRCKTVENIFGDCSLFLIATPTTIDDLITLNPALAGIL